MNFVVWSEPPSPLEERLNQAADRALKAHTILRAGKRLPRKLKSELGLFMLPNPKRAQELVEYARQLFCERSDAGGAVRLLEQAILFDQITALDSGWHAQRADLYEQLGILAPRTALRLYAMGIKFKHLDADDYAEQAYSRASLIDEPFLWSANNFSWMVATGLSSGGAEKGKGVAMAEWTCVRSGWGCWCFTNTLAASYARIGDFARAIAWQEVSLDLAPNGKKSDLARDLLLFRDGVPIQSAGEVAAGGETPREHLADIDVDLLWAGAVRLMNIAGPTVH